MTLSTNRLQWETAEELDLALAKRLKLIRKRRGLTQSQLSLKCGVSLGSIRRFEREGLISLLSLTRIAMALDCASQIRNLFTDVPYRDIQEVLNEAR